MNQNAKEFVIEKSRELMESPACCPEAKAAAQAWLDALGTPKEADETKKYFTELEEDLEPIDELIAFLHSDNAKQYFEGNALAELIEHTNGRKAAGEQFCDCPACAAAAEILAKKSELV